MKYTVDMEIRDEGENNLVLTADAGESRLPTFETRCYIRIF